MPIHPDFHSMLRSMTDQYCDGKTDNTKKTETAEGYQGKTCRRALEVFYATCKEQGLDYTKPRPKSKQEKFSWVGKLAHIPKTNLIRGKALHPIKTFHPEEYFKVRQYLEEELKKAAKTLVGKPLTLDHEKYLHGKVIDAEYEDGAIEYVAECHDKEIIEKVKNGKIKKVSVEYDWEYLKSVNGIAPLNITFTGLSLLEKYEAGDPQATVEVWEGIIKRLKESKGTYIEDQEIKPEISGVDDYIEWQLLKDRTIMFHGRVNESICQEASKKLEYLGRISKKPIKVILNSVGGEVYHGMLVFDTIKELVNKGIEVICEARGLAASMGCILLQAGTKRLATEHTRFLIHEVSSFAWGKASEVEEQSEELKKVNEMLKKILAERTGKTPEEIEKIWHKKDVWMSAEEALEFGLIDAIVKGEEPLQEAVVRGTLLPLHAAALVEDIKVEAMLPLTTGEYILGFHRDPYAFMPEHFSTHWLDRESGILAIVGRLRARPESRRMQSILFDKQNWNETRIRDWFLLHPHYLIESKSHVAKPSQTQGDEKMEKEELVERVWTRAYINDLPDTAFALIQKGGEKDESGRTTPRSLRRLPHHDAQGRIDIPHLRNANARAPQMKDVSEEERRQAIEHLERHKRALGIGAAAQESKDSDKESKDSNPKQEDVDEPKEPEKPEAIPEPSIDEIIFSVETALHHLEDRLDKIESGLKEMSSKLPKATEQQGLVTAPEKDTTTFAPKGYVAIADIEAKIPEIHITRTWNLGAQRFLQDIKRVIHEAKQRDKEDKQT